MRPEHALALKKFPYRAPIALSPDGQWLAYTLELQEELEAITDERYSLYSRTGVSSEAIGSSVWLTHVASGETKKAIPGVGSSWAAAWSPDGQSLAFCSDHDGQARLWIWEKASGTARRVSDIIVRPFFQFDVPQWTPDSKKVLLKALPEGVTIETAAAMLVPASSKLTGLENDIVTIYEAQGNSQLQTVPQSRPMVSSGVGRGYLSDLAMIDIATGSVQRIARKITPVSFFISPDGSSVAVANMTRRESEELQQLLFDIVVVSTTNGSARTIAHDVPMGYGHSMSWSPDSRRLAYTTLVLPGRRSSGQQATADCFLVTLRDGSVRNLTGELKIDFGSNYRQPLWDAAGQMLYLVGANNLWAVPVVAGTPRRIIHELNMSILEVVTSRDRGRIWLRDNGHSAVIVMRDDRTKVVGFYRITLESSEVTRLGEESKTYGSPLRFSLSVSDDGRRLAYVAEDTGTPAEIYLRDGDLVVGRRVTHANPQIDSYQMGSGRLIDWKSEDGTPLQGSLLLPPGYQEGRRYPLVVEVYGGLMGSNLVNTFGLGGAGINNAQLLATRGYAVLMPDIPQHVGSPMRDVAKAVLPAINRVVELGIADPERIGVTGQSYGGYCTLALLVQSNRFKAAVIRSGLGADLITYYGVMSASGDGIGPAYNESGQGQIGGSPWQYRDRYIENSPIFYLDRVTTPVMITHGTADTAIPQFLADQTFVALRRLEKHVVYLKYRGGEHGTESLDRSQALHYFSRVISWFDQHLKGDTQQETPPAR